MLCHRDLVKTVERSVTGFQYSNIGISSLDVRLGNEFWTMQPSDAVIDLQTITREDISKHFSYETADKYVLHPGRFVRAIAVENFNLPYDVSAIFTLRSIVAQFGLQHSTSIFIRPNWEGRLILELSNTGVIPLALSAGMLIGQIHFFEAKG